MLVGVPVVNRNTSIPWIGGEEGRGKGSVGVVREAVLALLALFEGLVGGCAGLGGRECVGRVWDELGGVGYRWHRWDVMDGIDEFRKRFSNFPISKGYRSS